MTTETRTLIEFKDIMGVEIECPECHLSLVYPIAKLSRIGPAYPHCSHALFDAREGSRDSAYPAIDNIEHIAENLRRLTRDDRTDIHAQIRLRVNVEPQGGTTKK
jgi:hypothetical protein